MPALVAAALPTSQVPLLHRQLHATFQAALAAPLLWPKQKYFFWADLLDQPAPTRLTVRLLRLTPPSGLRGRLAVRCRLTLSETTYDQVYTTAPLVVDGERPIGSGAAASASASAATAAGALSEWPSEVRRRPSEMAMDAGSVGVHEEPELLLEGVLGVRLPCSCAACTVFRS